MDELIKWVWSGRSDRLDKSFVYYLPTKRSLFFKAEKNESYKLIIEVLEADENAVDYKIRLRGRSGI
jgi:hypothetical protein